MPDDISTDDSKVDNGASGSVVKKKRAPRKKASAAGSVNKKNNNTDMHGETPVLTLDAVLVINKANELRDRFSAFLDKGNKEIIIDASAVEMIDTAIIQLLYSFITALKSDGLSATWQSPSEEFVGRVRSLGLGEMLGIEGIAAD